MVSGKGTIETRCVHCIHEPQICHSKPACRIVPELASEPTGNGSWGCMAVAQVDLLEGVCISRCMPWQRYAVEELRQAGPCGSKAVEATKCVSGRRLHSQGVHSDSWMMLHHVWVTRCPERRPDPPHYMETLLQLVPLRPSQMPFALCRSCMLALLSV